MEVEIQSVFDAKKLCSRGILLGSSLGCISTARLVHFRLQEQAYIHCQDVFKASLILPLGVDQPPYFSRVQDCSCQKDNHSWDMPPPSGATMQGTAVIILSILLLSTSWKPREGPVCVLLDC